MSDHYRKRKDKTHLSASWRITISGPHYINVYIWTNRHGMYANVLSNGDPQWEAGKFRACFLAMESARVGDDVYIPAMYGEVHLVLGELGVGVVAHELMHCVLNWMSEIEIDEEGICLLVGELNRKFWNKFYQIYELEERK